MWLLAKLKEQDKYNVKYYNGVLLVVYDDLKALLSVYGISKEFTDAELEALIKQAKALAGVDFLADTVFEESDVGFKGKTYITERYPVNVDSLKILLENKEVIPDSITTNGVIRFKNVLTGKLLVKYSLIVTKAYEEQYIYPIVIALIRGIEGKNISSVKEGDITLNYNSSQSLQLDNLIERAKNQYNARVRMI